MLIWHFLDSRAEICQIFRVFFGKSTTPRRHSEINWPLVCCKGELFLRALYVYCLPLLWIHITGGAGQSYTSQVLEGAWAKKSTLTFLSLEAISYARKGNLIIDNLFWGFEALWCKILPPDLEMLVYFFCSPSTYKHLKRGAHHFGRPKMGWFLGHLPVHQVKLRY